jgi:hypothetical protein
MNQPVAWYRSSGEQPDLRVGVRRRVRNWVRGLLPEPDVRGRMILLHSRRTFPKFTPRGFRSEFHGLFSEFHSVLGALQYAGAHGAAGVRVQFRSPLYEEPGRGPNWWTYFFDTDTMRMASGTGGTPPEISLDGVLTKYGRYGGFSDIIGGALAHLYPVSYGIDRPSLHRLLSTHIRVRQEILDEVQRFAAAQFHPGAFIVGVHYRGTDSTHRLTGSLTHYRTSPAPYEVYAEEVRRVLEAAAPVNYQVFIATDEIDCVEFMRRSFGERVVALDDAPRVRPHEQAVHLNRAMTVSNYQKGKSALVDCLLLAAVSYLVKGRSNLSDASLIFNPALPFSFRPDIALNA